MDLKIFYVYFLLESVFASPSIPEITHHPLNTTVIRGEPLTLECRSSGFPPPQIRWFKNGSPLFTSPDRMILPDGSLLFLRVFHSKKETDSGDYHCTATNSQGSASSHIATLEIAYMKDEFKALPRDTEATLGRDIVLECSPPAGHPEPVVKWKRDGDHLDLTSSKRIKIDGQGNLLIQSVQKSDEGRYQCSAGNIANKKMSKAVRLNVNAPPHFISKPKDINAIAGEEAFIDCRVGGDPYPDVTWTKERGDIDISKLKIVSGKGLRIKNVNSHDSGRYICTAKNRAGVISSSSFLTISIPPVITERPLMNVQVRVSEDPIELHCGVSGSPSPFVYWSREADAEAGLLILPGEDKHGIIVKVDGTLYIENPQTMHSGHYTCTAVNDAGSAIARSHVLVYDPIHQDSFPDTNAGLELDEARIVTTLEEGVRISDISAVSSTSLKVKWHITARHKYIDGFYIRYRKVEDPIVATVRVLRSDLTTSFVIDNLEEHSEYEVFIQPYFQNIVGKPASIKRIITHPDLPSEAPLIREARLLNSTTVFLSWNTISPQHINGPLRGYEILIKGNGTSVNNTVDAETNEVTLIVNGMAPNKIYMIQISVINSIGHGPFSSPLEISKGFFDEAHNPHLPIDHENKDVKTTWIIAIVAVLTFVLIFISGVFFYKRKFHSLENLQGKPLPQGYLPTSTSSEEFHCHLYQKTNSGKLHTGLWIDRDYEKSSNSSEKKLLNDARTPQSSSSGHSDTEYAYVDNKHNISSFTTSSGGSSTGRKAMESPEPYATTDILQTNYSRPLSTKSGPCCNTSCHYADPIFVSRKCSTSGESHSCDNLINTNGVVRPSLNQVPNLLEMIPPPPVHPPPPHSVHYCQSEVRCSHESMISPQYLFHHPVYTSCSATPTYTKSSSTPRSMRQNLHRASDKSLSNEPSTSNSSSASRRLNNFDRHPFPEGGQCRLVQQPTQQRRSLSPSESSDEDESSSYYPRIQK
uniref:Roundabout homolog 2like [Nasonia vitripennis] n=1 Tax=Lepeophtheirus salmonis TaxID=72036 RepID=A0A0K2V5X8_LEPSM